VKRERVNRSFRLRLLALVLACLLLWYSINPAPYRSVRRRQVDDEADAKRREAQPSANRRGLSLNPYSLHTLDLPEPSVEEEEDDFEWPEFIDG
jgi:hypothetical protein